ncbi:N-acetylglucosamine kinase [Sphaerisporangium siamense]|uniref:N-acetylglucosamine kinase-like BadF-type ATPase n=1 Tax=Sphaerisporangium siamense TaxID=795645 RepID=A0A7W7DDC1_9ACTN|nr:BadF/BadG/BcrA/BcrD ATPase family protein [Sphaerisporangium siamense]MBB4703596.1 N-acetylglucosamine kinase-like BadF-type ATPase [Sphaerisporangium siamense]GII82068.1 N-acetylglucosamine kinase [Sphaerisporangium siamense]
MRTVLAVDGGNSKTDVALVAEDGTVLARGRGAGFTPQSSGVPAAIDVLGDTARRILGEDAATPYADLVSAYVAGADLPVEEESLREEISSRGYGADVVVGNDTFALLRAGATRPWGVAVVCGAGINAVGVSPGGEIARFPALGRLSGDWGGGYGLGEEALWHAVRAEDGRGPATLLLETVRGHFGVRRAEEVVLAIHFGELAHEVLHGLVPPLLEAATGDAVARAVVERQADEVAVLGVVAMRRLGLLERPCEVVLGGGVLTARHPLLHGMIEERYAAQAPAARLLVTDLPPIVGAALLGLERLGAEPGAAARLREGFAEPAPVS